jgi:hypothetical protein
MKALMLCYGMASIIAVAPAFADANYVAAPVAKPSFAMRHPKLHKTGVKIRRTCQRLQPIAAFGGSCAQIVMLVTRR